MTDYRTLADNASSQFDGVEIETIHSESATVKVQDGKTEEFCLSNTTDAYIRVFRGGHSVAGFAGGAGIPAVQQFLDIAAQVISSTPEHPYRRFPNITPFSGEWNQTIILPDDNALLDAALLLERSAYAAHADVKRVRECSASRNSSVVTLYRTGESPVSYRTGSTAFTCAAVAENGSDAEIAYDYTDMTLFDLTAAEETGRSAGKRAAALTGGRPVESGKYHILFSEAVMEQFIGLIASLCDAEEVLKGTTLLGGKLGRAVASPLFTLTDNPLLADGTASHPFDDEGAAACITQLISGGNLLSYLHNSATATALGLPNTGHAARMGGRVGISPTNLLLQPAGDQKAVAMIPRLLHITDVMGMHTANPVSGDFSVGISGYYMENGELVHPFRETVLSGNLRDLLMGVISISEPSRQRGSIRTGSTLFDVMSVGGI